MTKYTTPTKTCNNCGKVFTKSVTCSKKAWYNRRGCSPSCAAKLRGAPWLEPYKLRAGATLGNATQFTTKKTTGIKNVMWKGDKASYAAKHIWMKYHFGTPQECENCGTAEKRMYHWANISGEYKRNRDDWLRLCVPCHRYFDYGKLATA